MRRLLALVVGLATMPAYADCNFDNSGTISNPDDPACRDTQLVFTENNSSGNNIALGYAPPVPVDSLTAVDGFRTWDSLHARHQELALGETLATGTVVGQTRAGREIWAYSVGDSDSETLDGRTEGAAIVNGGIHAREWQSPEVLTGLYEQLVEMADDTSVGQFLHDNFNAVLIPVLNIDGFIQTQNFPTRATADARQPRDGRMRRKNLRNPSGSTIDEDLNTTGDSFFGVDLNRNSIHGWGLNGGSSSNTISLVYRGTSASSEPEIQALRTATELGPANRLRLGIDVHSFTQIYFTPMTGNVRRDDITETLATRMRAVTGLKYRFGPDPVATFGIGTVADYFAYEFDVPAWTLETEPLNGGQDYGGTGASHSGFVLPDSEIARVRDELAETMILGFYRQSGPAHAEAVQITNVVRDEIVYEARWVADGDGRRLDVVTSRAIIPSEDHRIWVGFNKPMRWFDDTGALASFPGQTNRFERLLFQAPDESFTFSWLGNNTEPQWLTVPGGAPDGYRRYRGDAFVHDLDFTMGTETLQLDTPVSVALQLELSDLAQMALDADPATPADWQGGHWTGYEDTALQDSDSGGAYCKFVVFFASDADAAAPPADAACPAFVLATTPPPDPPPPPTPPPPAPSGGGGGGHGLWLLPFAVLLRHRR